MSISDELSALQTGAVVGAIAERRQAALAGPDRGAFLQGLLTNDIAGLAPGAGCYAAWLTPQGRMLTDMHVLESGDMLLLDVPAAEVDAIVARLEQFHFGENVQIENLTASLRSVWLHGPQAAALLTRLLPSNATRPDFSAWCDYQNGRADLSGLEVVVARIDQLGVPGYVVYAHPTRATELVAVLVQQGAIPASAEALEAARIQVGYPIFGVDMTDDTIPLEADIQQRAISLTKGCYVGQEVIIRVLHRGQGRVVRKLVGLRIDSSLPERGSKVFAGGREIGFITSAAESPRAGRIALGYLHRDFTEVGTVVEIDAAPHRLSASVRSLSAA